MSGSIKLFDIKVYQAGKQVKVNLRITPSEGKSKHLIMTWEAFQENKEQIVEVATDIGTQLSQWKEETNKKTAPKPKSKSTAKPKGPSVNADAAKWGKEQGLDVEQLLKDKKIEPTAAGKVTLSIIKKYHDAEELRKKKDALTAPSESRDAQGVMFVDSHARKKQGDLDLSELGL